MKKLGNAILMIDIPFNVVGIILCVWRMLSCKIKCDKG